MADKKAEALKASKEGIKEFKAKKTRQSLRIV